MEHARHSTNREWLGDFLRGRRERLSPQDYGFPVMHRRRARGLRRDEVAQLAGISVAYYTWIEQGRVIHMSADVLSAIARALRLTAAERAHLFALVGAETRECPAFDACVHPTLAHLFDVETSTWCAHLFDANFNVLRVTQLAAALFGVVPNQGLESNIIYRLFADPTIRTLCVDWEGEARLTLGMFRHALARQPDNSEGFRLLQVFLEMPDFGCLWRDYDVRMAPSPEEFFRSEPWQIAHPQLGLMRIHRLAMALPARADRTIAVSSPADAETRLKFAQLLEQGAPPVRYLQTA